MTYFPFPGMPRSRDGTGEVGTTVFAVPQGSLGFWKDRFEQSAVKIESDDEAFGEKRIHFRGPDGDSFALVEVKDDPRAPWAHEGLMPSTPSVAFIRSQCGFATKARPRNC